MPFIFCGWIRGKGSIIAVSPSMNYWRFVCMCHAHATMAREKRLLHASVRSGILQETTECCADIEPRSNQRYYVCHTLTHWNIGTQYISPSRPLNRRLLFCDRGSVSVTTVSQRSGPDPHHGQDLRHSWPQRPLLLPEVTSP